MNRTEQIKHWQGVIETLTASYNRLDDACNAAIKAGCMDSEGRLHESIWGAFEDAVQIIDPDGWLDWWLWDNGRGGCGMPAGANGKKAKPVKTAVQMARVIVDFKHEP
jgi:hypothetical protein